MSPLMCTHYEMSVAFDLQGPTLNPYCVPGTGLNAVPGRAKQSQMLRRESLLELEKTKGN